MHYPHVLAISFFLTAACASSPAAPTQPIDRQAVPAQAAGCFAIQLGGRPSPDVSLPIMIELTEEPAPGFVEPGRFAVREPGATTPRAPISWWMPQGSGAIQLVLGGGYTGYSFSLNATSGGAWAGEGVYWADMGLEPAPGPLPIRLAPRSCP
jgi:hypothetical protein